MTDQSKGFAGLPAGSGGPSLTDDRPFIEYTLPKSLIAKRGSWNMEDEYLTFRMVEITPGEQDRAAKLGGDNQSALTRELVFQSIKQIGSRKVAADRDFLELWWKQIGPKARFLVHKAFFEMSSVEDDDIEKFLDSGQPG